MLKLILLLRWCSFNTVDINWDKTVIMFIKNKRITLPNVVMINEFKTLVLPFFDYCSTIYIYFSKQAIQKLYNTHDLSYLALNGMLKRDYKELNSNLELVNSKSKHQAKVEILASNY